MKNTLQVLHIRITLTVTAIIGITLLFLWVQLQHSSTSFTITTASTSDSNAISTFSDVNVPITISIASTADNNAISTVRGSGNNAISTASDINVPTSISPPYAPNASFILTTRFGGQQGAGLLGVAAQQCFISNLDIPAYMVEPFVTSSVLHHAYLKNSKNALKFSDMFNIDIFNNESKKSGYGPLIRWDVFRNSAPDRAILVTLQWGGQKGTHIVWDGHNAAKSPCYKGTQYSELQKLNFNLINITLCVVRIVRICCVYSHIREQFSHPNTIMTTQELRRGIFGDWISNHMTVLFQHWSAWWHIPQSCKQHSIEGKILPSEQIYKYANAYKDSFLKSTKVVAFLLRFELLIRLRNFNVSECLIKLRHVQDFNRILTNASVFVTADLGQYESGTWERTFSEYGLVHKKKQIKNTFMNALSGFIDSVTPWNFDEWESSFSQITGGIKDVGYSASIQKTIASMADCLIFLEKGGSNFQNLIIQEYKNYHPNQSEQCIHFVCMADCPNCSVRTV